MKTVYLVRHGESVDNVSPVFQSIHSPLSDKGTRQAEIMADRIAKVSFDALIASPVMRARQTAEVIAAKTGKELELCDDFVERVKPSAVDGKSWDDQDALKIYREWDDSLYTPGKRVQDGENYDDSVARADKALGYLLERAEDNLVVVTHGHFLRTMVARVLLGEELTGSTLKRIQRSANMENTGITVLHYKESYDEGPAWRLWTHNDHAHFAE